MLALIRSRITMKLTLSLALTLCLVMAGLAGVYFTVVDRLMADQEARAELYRGLNQDLRKQVFRLQARLIDIPKRLRTDPIPVLRDWAEQTFAVTVRTYRGRDRIVDRFKTRGQRRDVQKENRVVVMPYDGGAAIAYGVFEDGRYTDTVEELVMPGADPAGVRAKVDAVLSAATGADALEARVAELTTALVDDALAAEATRNAIIQRIDGIAVKEHAVTETAHAARLAVVGVSLAAVALAILLVWLVMRRMVTDALARLSHAASAIAGNQDVAVGFAHRTDEIGALAKGVARFKETLAEIHALKAEQEAERAAREAGLTARLSNLSTALEQGMGARVTVVTASTGELVGIAEELDRLAGAAHARATESTELAEASARFTDDVMSVVDSLRLSAERIAAEVRDQRELTAQVAAEADQVSAAVRDLTDTAGAIGSVVGLIEDIADQTKLLALNASIEASRAGAAGAGFAVVAGEVKKLSGETADATRRIAERIDSFRAGIRAAAGAVSSIQARARAVADGMRKAAGDVELLSGETASITASVADAATNARRVAAVNQEVDAAARETGQMSGQMTALTDRITAAVEDTREHLRTILADASARGTEPADSRPIALADRRLPPLPQLALAAE
ncbi:methyl-accepting chemotaxis protein [Thalassobaculum fulvum]|nr:methyl-accepting chemotaxis protein [Thalassobaculum fulvum]